MESSPTETGPFSDPEAVVREFWRRMATNHFKSVQEVLADNLILDWPQSCERICGPSNFVRMNAEYPSHGRWSFELRRLVAERHQVVTHVAVTDGVQAAEAISFFTVVSGKISRIVEFWPDSFPASEHRRHLVESMPSIRSPVTLLPILEDGSISRPAPLDGPAAEVIAATVCLYARRGFQPPWIGYLAMEGDLWIGSCGFAHPPRNGEVEIAYFTFPGNEGRGAATRMARELLRQTRHAARSARVGYIAHTLPTESPSTSILRKLGFRCVGEIHHPDDGTVWKWTADAEVAGAL
ncbi:MAG: GNAT family N-acetyltransferase [Verrucomicrobiales bacterium]|nr:GNAT family N-acetyltransferase [Verrucomicrobiales bacterium]